MVTEPEAKGDGYRKFNIEEDIKQSELAEIFITAGANFEEALGRGVLRDDLQRSYVVLLQQRLLKVGLLHRIQGLTAWLNAGPAVGGYNRNLAAMTGVQIFVPEAAGTKLSKQGHKEYIETLRRRGEEQKEEQRDKENGR